MMPSVKLAPICDIRNAARDIGPLSLAGGVVREKARARARRIVEKL